MLNQTALYGYVAFDVNLRTTSGGREYVTNALNVRRNYKGQDGKYGYDSIPFAIFGPSAKTFAQYCHKGSTVNLYGSLQSNLESVQVLQNGVPTNRTFNKITLDVKGFDIVSKPEHNQQNTDSGFSPYREPTDELPY